MPSSAAGGRPKSTSTSLASQWGREGASRRNAQQRAEREAGVQLVADLWPVIVEGGLPFGRKRWTRSLAAMAIAARWPGRSPMRSHDTLISYLEEAMARRLMPTF